LISKETGVSDPYKVIKKESNETALKLYPELKGQLPEVEGEKDRLFMAAKLAIAGNIIDFGPASGFDLEISGSGDMIL